MRSRLLLLLVAAFGVLATSAAGGGPVKGRDAAALFKAGQALTPAGTISSPKSKDGLVSVLVKLDVDALASYTGGVSGYAATSPGATGAKLDLASADAMKYRSYVHAQARGFERAAQRIAPQAKITNVYDIVYGGVSMLVPADKVSALSRLPGVVDVQPDKLQQIDTDVTPKFIGADHAWKKLGGQGSAGEGVIVGVLDTGIWPEHPSYSDPDPLGKPYAAPPPPVSGTRQCEFSGGANPGPAFACNNKLIGADRFMATYDAVIGLLPAEFTTARDDNGHGTHTSSTAGGNRGVAASIFGVSRGIVSGIAPRAHVIMYKVCGDEGCFDSDSVAAVGKAITDGVNVINFSISGGENPYADAVSLAFLDAYNAGVFVSASAGNSGPGAETVAHREPWTATVGASTAKRAFVNSVTLTGGASTVTVEGTSLTDGIFVSTPIVSAADAPYNDAFCANSTPGAFTGKIVVCQRGGGIGRVAKGFNVMQSGAVGMVLYNQAANVTDLETDNHFLPTSHVQFAEGQQVLAFLAANPGSTATMTAGESGDQQGDVMASFSSRGGPGQTLGISKPDVTAPGVQILAGHTPASASSDTGPTGELFQAIAGTSMSSPHNAGAAALLKDLFPTWTPGQIKSALMTSAEQKVFKEDGVTPTDAFDDGTGRIELQRAIEPGVTFDESGADYVSLKDELWNSNYPSLYVPNMPGIISVQRTMTNVLGKKATFNFKVKSPSDMKIGVPRRMDLAAGASGTFTITVDATAVPLGETRFGLIEIEGAGKWARFPVTIVRGTGAVPLTKSCTPATFAITTDTTCTLVISNPLFSDADVNLTDNLPSRLQVVPGSATGGATISGNSVLFNGTVPASAPPNVTIAPGTSPAGYMPLSLFGGTLVLTAGDETISNVNVPSFTYAGTTYSQIGMTSNGYAVVGGGTAADVEFVNQNLPNAVRPNNVLAPWWTDLNPGAGGRLLVNVLTDGVDEWIILEWEAVKEFSTAKFDTFQIWIGVDGDANPGEDITFVYGTLQGNGDGGFLTVGAENVFGNRGQNAYFDGTGTLPTSATELRVTGTAGTAGSKTITFEATGISAGPWTNCASMTTDISFGTAVSCFSGTVTP